MRTLLLTSMIGAAIVSAGSAGAASIHVDRSKNINMNRSAGSCQAFTEVISTNLNTVCAVTGSGGSFQGGGEFGNVVVENGAWVFHGNSCQPGVFFNITCFRVDP
jgi:hypothetical protein